MRRSLSPSRMWRTAAAVVVVVVAVGGVALTPLARESWSGVAAAAPVNQSSTTVGISDNDLYFADMDTATISEHLRKMKALGVTTIRLAIPWAAVETAKGRYAWTGIDNMVNAAAAQGMGILGAVNTTPDWARAANTNLYCPPTSAADYGAFMGVLAGRYKSKMSALEVWNEPNGATGYQPSPNPAGYTALLKAAYPKIKAANSAAVVIGGVLGSTLTWGTYTLNPVDFVQQMYAAGAAGTFDALSFHPYQNTTKFSQGASLANSPLNQVTAIRQLMVSKGDTGKKIWATEYGLPTGQVGETQQADYINDFLTTWRTLAYAGPAFIYTLKDRNTADTTDAENTFGVYRDDWTPKPAATTISSLIKSTP